MSRRSARPSLEYELAFWCDGMLAVAGLDEAGRGALAGPVVAAAVILPATDRETARNWTHSAVFRPLARADDSKQLTPRTREALFQTICERARAFAIGTASHSEVDALGIVRASQLAMQRALDGLSLAPDALLLDALILPELDVPQQGIIHGDRLSLSIAAASILAKVARDRMMRALDVEYPAYEFGRHKGYGTAVHLAALRTLGPSPVHRRSYAPVRAVAGGA